MRRKYKNFCHISLALSPFGRFLFIIIIFLVFSSLCVHLNLFFSSPYSQYVFSPIPGPSSIFSDILIRKSLVGNSTKETNYLLFGIQRKNWDQKISPQLAHPRLRFSLSLPTRAAQDVFCKCPSPLYLIAWLELL